MRLTFDNDEKNVHMLVKIVQLLNSDTEDKKIVDYGRLIYLTYSMNKLSNDHSLILHLIIQCIS